MRFFHAKAYPENGEVTLQKKEQTTGQGSKNWKKRVRLLIDRIRLAVLAFMGLPDSPRWLRERDEARSEVDGYRYAAGLRIGEFVGPETTADKIHRKLRSLEEEVFRLRGQVKRDGFR